MMFSSNNTFVLAVLLFSNILSSGHSRMRTNDPKTVEFKKQPEEFVARPDYAKDSSSSSSFGGYQQSQSSSQNKFAAQVREAESRSGGESRSDSTTTTTSKRSQSYDKERNSNRNNNNDYRSSSSSSNMQSSSSNYRDERNNNNNNNQSYEKYNQKSGNNRGDDSFGMKQSNERSQQNDNGRSKREKNAGYGSTGQEVTIQGEQDEEEEEQQQKQKPEEDYPLNGDGSDKSPSGKYSFGTEGMPKPSSKKQSSSNVVINEENTGSKKSRNNNDDNFESGTRQRSNNNNNSPSSSRNNNNNNNRNNNDERFETSSSSSRGGNNDFSIKEKKKKRRLEFVHITKTGGSAIEVAAAKHNIMWGACHYWKIKYQGCMSPDWEFPKSRNVDRMPANLKYMGEPWHCPPHWNVPNEVEGADTFVVIRNPYQRLVSEYYCSAFGYRGDDRDDPAVFNRWLGGNLTELAIKLQGHMLPQHYYVYDEHGDKIITHIVRYENLKEEFDALMEEYDLPVRMPAKNAKTVHHTYHDNLRRGQKKPKHMTVDDISPENVQKINEVYARDFEFFGYPMIPAHALTPEQAAYRERNDEQVQATTTNNGPNNNNRNRGGGRENQQDNRYNNNKSNSRGGGGGDWQRQEQRQQQQQTYDNRRSREEQNFGQQGGFPQQYDQRQQQQPNFSSNNREQQYRREQEEPSFGNRQLKPNDRQMSNGESSPPERALQEQFNNKNRPKDGDIQFHGGFGQF